MDKWQAYLQYLKVISLRNRKKKSEMHLGFQLIDLLFIKASAEMVSVEDRLSRKGNKEKSRVVPNYTRT